MNHFSQTSLDRLNSCDCKLVMLMHRVLQVQDIVIIEGYRDEGKQTQAYMDGKTQVPWPRSMHNKLPSLAVDVAPYFPSDPHIRWDDTAAFIRLAGIVLGVANVLAIPIRWGGDWNMNGDQSDESFRDLVHFELL